MIRWAPLLLLTSPLLAAEPGKDAGLPDKVSYYRDIRPIFQQSCQGCHQPAKPLGDFVMTSYPDLFKKGEHDQSGIVPAKPNASYIVKLIRPVVEPGLARMPKGKDPLPERQIKLVEKWIEQGAHDDTPPSARATLIDADHPPIYHQTPVITSVAFSPNGELLAVAGYHEVLLHKADGSELVARLIGVSERIESLAFSPDGKTLAVTGGARADSARSNSGTSPSASSASPSRLPTIPSTV